MIKTRRKRKPNINKLQKEILIFQRNLSECKNLVTTLKPTNIINSLSQTHTIRSNPYYTDVKRKLNAKLNHQKTAPFIIEAKKLANMLKPSTANKTFLRFNCPDTDTYLHYMSQHKREFGGHLLFSSRKVSRLKTEKVLSSLIPGPRPNQINTPVRISLAEKYRRKAQIPNDPST